MVLERNLSNEMDSMTKVLLTIRNQGNELYESIYYGKDKNAAEIAKKKVFDIVNLINKTQVNAHDNIKLALELIRESSSEILAAAMKNKLDKAEISAKKLLDNCNVAIEINKALKK